MICPKCNFENDSVARFCENCGTSLQSVPSSKEKTAKVENGNIAKWRIPIMVSGVILGLVLFVIGSIAIKDSVESIITPQSETTDFFSVDTASIPMELVSSDSIFVPADSSNEINTNESDVNWKYYEVNVNTAYIYDYYKKMKVDPISIRSLIIPIILLVEYEFEGYGYVTYRDENRENHRGYLKMSDLKSY